MKFNVTEVFSTGDKNRFGITGYLSCSEDSENELMAELISAQTVVLTQDKSKRDTIKILKDRIKYCKLSIDSCGTILDMFRDSFNIQIDVVLDAKAVIVPKSCEPLAKMELRRLMH